MPKFKIVILGKSKVTKKLIFRMELVNSTFIQKNIDQKNIQIFLIHKISIVPFIPCSKTTF